MAQLDLYANRGGDAAAYPYIVDLQSDLVAQLDGRVVAPLAPADEYSSLWPTGLVPLVTVNGGRYAVLLSELAAVDRRLLGEPVGSLAAARDALLRGLDLLFTGV